MKDEASVDRRTVMRAAGALGAVSVAGCARSLPGDLRGADARRGHQLRDKRFPEPQTEEEAGILIAGGGVAGLSAAWTLAEAGVADVTLLELEDRTGGNARSGRTAVTAYPLGAHYLPVPNREARALRHLLTRLGMIVGEKQGAPVYDPYQLCGDLEERLFWRGRWQEGLYPLSGLTERDKFDRAAFDASMARFAAMMGGDGKPAFAVPSAYSSQDPGLRALDRLSFAAWLDQQGWQSPILRAHVRYCCRDDYGCEPDQVSAWAGLHYFAARRGWAADGAGDRELTWPEGNARLTDLMAARVRERITTGRTVFRVNSDSEGVLVDSFDHAANRSVRTRARAAILAMPHFVASRIAPALGPSQGFSYAPWVVANVSVSRLPAGAGAKLAWDNVSSASRSLGYVVATHQSASAGQGPSVLTWYLPLSDMEPAKARRWMIERPLADWQAEVRRDLVSLHPELEQAIERIDVWHWGHAMIRPVPGFVTATAPAALAAAKPPLFLAHSDLSGLSLFEEAHYHGVLAAEGAMRHIGHPHESLI